MRIPSLKAALAALFLLWASVGSMQAAHLLLVDVSNPAAVTVTGTGEKPLADLTGIFSNFAIRLVDFFTADSFVDNPSFMDAGSSLHTFDQAGFLDEAIVRGVPGVTTLVLRRGGTTAENFDQDEPAFVGESVFDMTGNATVVANLPSPGHIGNIIAFDGSGSTVLGTYMISTVPEPSTYGIVGAVACLALVALKRKKAFATS